MRKTFETIFNSNSVISIQYEVSKGFGSRERAYSKEVNAYFGPIWKNIPHVTPNYGPGKTKFEVDFYRQKYCSPKKLAHIR